MARTANKKKGHTFSLIEEIDSSKALFLAKAILDEFTCNMPEFSEQESTMIKNTGIQDVNEGKTKANWKEIRKKDAGEISEIPCKRRGCYRVSGDCR